MFVMMSNARVNTPPSPNVGTEKRRFGSGRGAGSSWGIQGLFMPVPHIIVLICFNQSEPWSPVEYIFSVWVPTHNTHLFQRTPKMFKKKKSIIKEQLNSPFSFKKPPLQIQTKRGTLRA